MTDFRIMLREDFILRNPLLTASGTYGYGDEIADLIDPELYGGIVTKSSRSSLALVIRRRVLPK